MLRVVLDTNVAVSAFLTLGGNSAKFLKMITDRQIRIYYSSDILAEYTEVLSRPRFQFSIADRESFIIGIKRFGVLTEPPASITKFVDETYRIFYDVAKFCETLSQRTFYYYACGIFSFVASVPKSLKVFALPLCGKSTAV